MRVETAEGRILESPSAQVLRGLVDALPVGADHFLIVEADGRADSFAQFYRASEGFWLEVRDGSAARHTGTAVRDEDALLGIVGRWLSGDDWQGQAGQHWQHIHPVPERIPVASVPGSWLQVGRYDGGLFLAGFCEVPYVHFFDAEGTHLRSEFGTEADFEQHRRRLRALPGCSFSDVALGLFQVEARGETWGLVDDSEEYEQPRVTLVPDDLAFGPPWDGLWDS